MNTHIGKISRGAGSGVAAVVAYAGLTEYVGDLDTVVAGAVATVLAAVVESVKRFVSARAGITIE